MRILVFEYVSGGGFAGKPVSPGALSEGFAMLRALSADFKAAGHSVATVLDSRLAAFGAPLEADCVARVSSDVESAAAFEVAIESTDAVFVIAPESGGVLESLVQGIERVDVTSLNCRSEGIRIAANKPMVLEHVKRLGFSTPNSHVVCINNSIDQIVRSVSAELSFPLVFKPVDGVSCSALTVVQDEKEVEAAIAKIRGVSASEMCLAQEFVPGVAASVSVYSNGSEALPVSLNKQNVTMTSPASESSYDGGVVPFDSVVRQNAFTAARKIVESYRDLRGYVGVDIVLNGEEPVVFEVNPRLTTSYVGLRMVSGFNPAEALVESILERKLPVDCETFGYACFAKAKTLIPSQGLLAKTFGLTGVFSPPFPISSDDNAIALITSSGGSLKTASFRLEKNRRRLLRILNGEAQ